MHVFEDNARFVEVYNDKETYPTIIDVALELGFSYQTVRNYAATLRGKKRRGEKVPELISRLVVSKASEGEKVSPREHAQKRADQLRADVTDLLTKSRYPVVNPGVVVVESFVQEIYDRITGARAEKEGTPRTWLSDTLKVENVEDARGRRFIFTSAQNDAPVHEEFWKSLKAYAEFLDADIVVGPLTYETQWWSENNPASRSYNTNLEEYLCFGQMSIGDKFVFCGEMNTLPTARRPISDLTTYSRGRWAVFPHPMLQLKSVPSTDPSVQAHQVMTTGSVTKPKIIPRKIGVKSIFHQIIGATIVEFDEDGDVFCRPINADEDGSFYDLNHFVKNGKVSTHKGVDAITCGDVHIAKIDKKNAAATFGLNASNPEESIIGSLRPKTVLIHDLHDNESRNHHHVHDNAYSYEMAVRGRDSVETEVFRSVEFLQHLKKTFKSKIVVVESNHDIALERYIKEGRYRNDGINVRYGLMLEGAYMDWRHSVAEALEHDLPTTSFSLLEWAIRKAAGSSLAAVDFVHDGKSYIINDVECGHHGFRGANGARGTVAGYAQIGRKMTIGDKHSPEILDGVYVAGTMQLQMGYNKGPSGWAVSHVIQYPNGKRCLITLQNGKWRAKK